jgi:hypothetical protein
VFFVDEDRRVYLELLKEHAQKYGLEILAYCLMTNYVIWWRFRTRRSRWPRPSAGPTFATRSTSTASAGAAAICGRDGSTPVP